MIKPMINDVQLWWNKPACLLNEHYINGGIFNREKYAAIQIGLHTPNESVQEEGTLNGGIKP